MSYSDESGFPDYGDEDFGAYADEQSGVDASHWSNDPGLVTFADAFMNALANEPAAIEKWYETYADQQGLRRLAEEAAAEAAAEITAKFGTREHQDQVLAAHRKAAENQ